MPYEDLKVIHINYPSYIWAIKTEIYLSFLWRSANKFTGLFKIIRA